jgi:hypothetical protein
MENVEVFEKNLPEKKFKAGSITATVWLNQTRKGPSKFSYRTVNLERNYKDKDNKWKSTSSLRLNDLPKAVLVLNKAYEYLATNDTAM